MRSGFSVLQVQRQIRREVWHIESSERQTPSSRAVKSPFSVTWEKLFSVRQQRSSRCECEKLNQAILVLKVLKDSPSSLASFSFWIAFPWISFDPKVSIIVRNSTSASLKPQACAPLAEVKQPRISVRLCKPLYLMVNVKADAPEMFVRSVTAGKTCVNISTTGLLTVMDVKGIVRVFWCESVRHPLERANVIAS